MTDEKLTLEKDLIKYAKRIAVCVHIATEEGPAKDISDTIKALIAKVKKLDEREKEIADLKAKLEELEKRQIKMVSIDTYSTRRIEELEAELAVAEKRFNRSEHEHILKGHRMNSGDGDW